MGHHRGVERARSVTEVAPGQFQEYIIEVGGPMKDPVARRDMQPEFSTREVMGVDMKHIANSLAALARTSLDRPIRRLPARQADLDHMRLDVGSDERTRRIQRDAATMIDDCDPITKPLRFLKKMGRQQDRPPLTLSLIHI